MGVGNHLRFPFSISFAKFLKSESENPEKIFKKMCVAVQIHGNNVTIIMQLAHAYGINHQKGICMHEKDIKAEIKANITPIAADAKNTSPNLPRPWMKASDRVIDSQLGIPISRAVL